MRALEIAKRMVLIAPRRARIVDRSRRLNEAKMAQPSIESRSRWTRSRIDIGGDSTFALALEGAARGHTLLYYGPRDLTFRDGKWSRARAAAVRAPSRAIISRWATLRRTICRRWMWC
jgi:hypothetical protein